MDFPGAGGDRGEAGSWTTACRESFMNGNRSLPFQILMNGDSRKMRVRYKEEIENGTVQRNGL